MRSCIGNCEYSRSSNDTGYEEDAEVNKDESEINGEDDDDDNNDKHSEETDADLIEGNE